MLMIYGDRNEAGWGSSVRRGEGVWRDDPARVNGGTFDVPAGLTWTPKPVY